MKNKILLLSATLILSSCYYTRERDNPLDPGGVNYRAESNTQTCPYNSTANTLACSEKTYKTVTIGSQVWMAENLQYVPTDRDEKGAWCYANSKMPDRVANCHAYGRLYDWATAMALPATCNSRECASQVQSKHQGVCPVGWHIPMDEDWKTLEITVGMDALHVDLSGTYRGTIGTKLKSITGWTMGIGTDEFGFTVLPAGFRPYDTGLSLGDNAFFWSASESGINIAWYRGLSGDKLGVDRYKGHNGIDYGLLKSYGVSVRCLKD